MTTIAERISKRLEELGKNPSAVALEAGLGRSSVRDIITGKVGSPRLDTLEKLTGPLECTLEYLTGTKGLTAIPPIEDGYFDPVEVVGPTRVEIGVFRTGEAEGGPGENGWPTPRTEKNLIYNDFRLPNHYFWLYQIFDPSLEDAHILPGDFLTVAAPREGVVPLKSGTIVVVRRRFSETSAEEISARFVEIIDGDIVLTSRSKNPKYKPIKIGDMAGWEDGWEDHTREVEKHLPNWHYYDEGIIIVDGVVVRVTRSLPV